MPNGQAQVSVLGLGRMGSALADALISAGYRTTVWNRTPARADDLVGKGAVRASTVRDAVQVSPLVIVCVDDYAAVRQVLDANVSDLAGRTLVNLTTGTPEDAQAMAAWTSDQGARYLDGAMMAVPQTVATPDAFFLYSGAEDAFDAHRQLLETLATSHYLGADAAVAELWDLALLDSGYATLTGFLHGAALLNTANVSPPGFVPLVTRWLHGMITFMSELAEEIASGDYSTGVSPVAMNRVAVSNLAHASRARGIDTDLHGPLRALLDRQVADGQGAESFASLFELMRHP